MTAIDEVAITFRKVASDKRAVLLPMVNGVDIPDVLNCTITEGVGTASVTIICNLPRGVLVEP
jgi:hypothetical protein